MELSKMIRDIKNFPNEGVVFRDITPLLKSSQGLRYAIDQMQEKIKDVDFDYVVGPESRGFIFGVPIAYNTNKGFIPVRKEGKLPFTKESVSYNLEYGTATIEIHTDAIKKGDRLVIVDDLLATGGTTKAMINLIESLGGRVCKIIYLIELLDLKGREKIGNYPVESIIKY